MDDRKLVRVFISSPADVRPERIVAERVIRRLDREFAYHFRVEPYLWEREPLVASQSFQELIVRPSETDVVVVILWSRLGVLLDQTKFVGPISGGPVTGTEWEFEDALASARSERRLPDLMLYRKTEKPKGEFGDRAEVEERQRQVEMVEKFMQRWTRDADGKAFTAASWSFSDTADFQEKIYQHLSELLKRRLPSPDRVDTIRWFKGSPYRGLESFEREHEQVFFGRARAQNEVRELLGKRIDDGTAFVLLAGASGSGKSSLAKAGLLPELSQPGMIGSVALVRWAVTNPGAFTAMADREAEAITGLAAAILSEAALPELANEPFGYSGKSLAAQLTQPVKDASHPIHQGLAAAGRADKLTERGQARLLLIVDQFEELFTAEGISIEQRDRYITALEALATSGHAWIIATMRSDFFDRMTGIPALARLATDGTYLLSPPDAAEIGDIIRRPAREAGLSFETDPTTHRSLDVEIQQVAAQDPGALPLLEYLLDQLWQRRERDTGRLTFAAYRELDGLEGAIGRRAEQVLEAQRPEVQAAFTPVLRALVTGLKQGKATARYARRADFPDGSPEADLIEAFAAPGARLVVSDKNQVRVAHEALLNHWPRARAQIEADARDLDLRGRLEAAAAQWEGAVKRGRTSLLLPSGLPLVEARALLQRWGAQLPELVRLYIRESVRAMWRRRLLFGGQLAAALATIPLIGAVVWAVLVWQGVREIEASMHFVEVPAGCALVGSPADEQGREPDEPTPKEVCVSSFRLGKFEVTQAQWMKVMVEDDNPSRHPGLEHPVEQISWDQAQNFLRRMSWFGKYRYRLPSGDEWEYAARARTTTSRYWGDGVDEICDFANLGDRALKLDYGPVYGDAAKCDDKHRYTSPVGSLQPNGFGLHDMLGNVGEWVSDCDPVASKFGASAKSTCKSRHARGASYFSVPEYVRSAFRARYPQEGRYSIVGFRMLREP